MTSEKEPPLPTGPGEENEVNLNPNPKDGIDIHGEQPASDAPESIPRPSDLTPKDVEAHTTAATLSTTISPKPYTVFSPGMKWFIVIMTTMASFFSPLSGQIYFPVLPILTKVYKITPSQTNISITTYLILQGLTPSFMGTFSDASGRRLGYILAFTIYTGANIGLALQHSYAALLALRALQSAGSSGTISFGYGVLADCITAGERGKYFGPMMAGALTAPALGPTIGGLLTQFLGWRAVFWFLTIISGGYLAIYIVTMPETHRKIVDNGSVIPLQWWRQSVLQFLSERRRVKRLAGEEREEYQRTQQALLEEQQATKIAFPNPLRSFMILARPDALCIVCYTGIVMFSNMVLMTSTPTLFPALYGLNELQVGLTFLPLGVSAGVGAIVNGRFLDWNYARVAKQLGLTVDKKRGDDLRDFPIEKTRLQIAFFAQGLQVAVFLPYGWALQKRASLAVPLVLQFIMGFCLIVVSNSLSTLLTDISPGEVSTASAASNLVRCLLGAVGAATVDDMLKGMGVGWCFVFLGLLLFAGSGLLWAEVIYGMRWRQKRWRKGERKGGGGGKEEGSGQ
ncbi:hypothetical protein PV08_11374 [Exophiala spinifera]|uniref:Major facilitator superfamily (MFS) profile domain-containing protein n=1 Tax=Exophiala spinifera TaxID=91928 RepID=A0A0D1Y6A3_9EURO|nr:uncharacterized protein PV08_11374 [Exophiala spinifera]KIW10411.1 hypothetical protein PV08_11374 [Exophiala spinifera]